jgi:hypothetical protein
MPWILRQKEKEHVLALEAPKRYEHFIKKIADTEIVWGLFDDGWALLADDGGKKLFPFWPHKEYADMFKDVEWLKYKPKEIPVNEYIDVLLPKLNKEGVQCAIFPVKGKGGISVAPDKVIADLKEELSKY